MSEPSPNRLMSVLVCWLIHAGLLGFIGVIGLGLGWMADPSALFSFWEPIVGAAVVAPFSRLVDLLISSAVWVLLTSVGIGVVTVAGFMRARWARLGLLIWTWLHIIGLIPLLAYIHIQVGLGGIIGGIVLLAELITGVATVWVMVGSLKILQQSDWSRRQD